MRRTLILWLVALCAGAVEPSATITVSLVPWENRSVFGEGAWFATAAPEIVLSVLAVQPALTIEERSAPDALNDELVLASAESDVGEAGGHTAHWVLDGSFSLQDDQVQFEVRIAPSAGGSVAWQQRLKGPADTYARLLRQAAAEATTWLLRGAAPMPQPSVQDDAPLTAAIPYYRARASLVRGDGEAALAGFLRATQTAPNFAAAWTGVGDACQLLGRSSAAFAAWQHAVACAPDAPDAAATLYRLAVASRDHPEHERRILDRLIVDYPFAREILTEHGAQHITRWADVARQRQLRLAVRSGIIGELWPALAKELGCEDDVVKLLFDPVIDRMRFQLGHPPEGLPATRVAAERPLVIDKATLLVPEDPTQVLTSLTVVTAGATETRVLIGDEFESAPSPEEGSEPWLRLPSSAGSHTSWAHPLLPTSDPKLLSLTDSSTAVATELPVPTGLSQGVVVVGPHADHPRYHIIPHGRPLRPCSISVTVSPPGAMVYLITAEDRATIAASPNKRMLKMRRYTAPCIIHDLPLGKSTLYAAWPDLPSQEVPLDLVAGTSEVSVVSGPVQTLADHLLLGINTDGTFDRGKPYVAHHPQLGWVAAVTVGGDPRFFYQNNEDPWRELSTGGAFASAKGQGVEALAIRRDGRSVVVLRRSDGLVVQASDGLRWWHRASVIERGPENLFSTLGVTVDRAGRFHLIFIKSYHYFYTSSHDGIHWQPARPIAAPDGVSSSATIEGALTSEDGEVIWYLPMSRDQANPAGIYLVRLRLGALGWEQAGEDLPIPTRNNGWGATAAAADDGGIILRTPEVSLRWKPGQGWTDLAPLPSDHDAPRALAAHGERIVVVELHHDGLVAWHVPALHRSTEVTPPQTAVAPQTAAAPPVIAREPTAAALNVNAPSAESRPDEAPDATAATPPASSSWWWILILVVVLGATGSAAFWWYRRHKKEIA